VPQIRNPKTVGITSDSFGSTHDGTQVDRYTLTNRNDLHVSIITLGGIVTELMIPDRDGRLADVVLGFASLDGYLAEHPYFGAIIGRYGNRIGNARFNLDGQSYSLAANDGENHLHGGHQGFDKVIWSAEPGTEVDGPSVELNYISPDGEEGYPGELNTTVIYTLTHLNELKVEYRATTDRPTPVNLTHHSYFNLKGLGESIHDHVLKIDADQFTPVDSGLIPTGELRDVTGTPMDFRQPAPIGARIDDDYDQLRLGRGYDHNWVLKTNARKPTLAVTVVEPATGRTMQVLTTEPGMQFYSGNYLDGVGGKGGVNYQCRSGFCIEAQHFPDSPNKPEFPSTLLRPGETYLSTTIYRFGIGSTSKET
jgi:aldose 1-epimerase